MNIHHFHNPFRNYDSLKKVTTETNEMYFIMFSVSMFNVFNDQKSDTGTYTIASSIMIWKLYDFLTSGIIFVVWEISDIGLRLKNNVGHNASVR